MPQSEPWLTVCIPAYNEVDRIGDTLHRVREYLDRQAYSHEVIVAVDGDDGTDEVVRRIADTDNRVHLIWNRARSGKGRGVRASVSQARGEVIGFLDADYKTPIEEAPKLLEALKSYDLAIGSRGLPASSIQRQQPLYRRAGSRVFRVGMRLITGLYDIVDTQCGFKFFRGDVARDLFRRQRVDGYMFDVEILYLAKKLGYRMTEVGVRWTDDKDSRLALVQGNWENLVDLFRIRLSTSAPLVDAGKSCEAESDAATRRA